jgi:hypothetical protein
MVDVFSDVFGLQNAEIAGTHPFYLVIKQQPSILLPLNLCAEEKTTWNTFLELLKAIVI